MWYVQTIIIGYAFDACAFHATMIAVKLSVISCQLSVICIIDVDSVQGL